MKKIAGIAETAGAKLRDRTRSVQRHVLNIARAARSKSQPSQRQISLQRAQVAQVQRWLANYQQLKEGIEAICEVNHDLLRADKAAARSEGTEA